MKKLQKKLSATGKRKQEKQTRYLSQAIQLEESVNPHIVRTTMGMVSLAIVCFLVWAGFTNINEVARTAGEVVPSGYQQMVQHLEGGMVQAIHVQEGELVQEGQVLLTMHDSGVRDDLDRALSKQHSLELQEERLRAFIEGREPDFSSLSEAGGTVQKDQEDFFSGMRSAREKEENIIRTQIKEKQQSSAALGARLRIARDNHDITQELYERKLKLQKKGYASEIQVLEDRKRVNDIKAEIGEIKNQIAFTKSSITQHEERLESLSARHQDEALERLAELVATKAENQEVIEKLQERKGRLTLSAPANGMIKGLAVNTVGSVVQPGQTLMEIVPFDKKLEVQVRIAPKDIGHIAIGLPVRVKLSSYDFSRYGAVQGKLEHISASTFAGERGERYYQGRITLAQAYVGNNEKNAIMPGMTVMADVITGEKTILQYLLKPIHNSMDTAFTER